jgi:hypothetical protein
VIGQLLAATGSVGFLPPIEKWQSGLLPYPVLLAFQALIILLYAKVCLDFSKGSGFFVVPSRRLGKGLIVFGSLYLAAMIVRHWIQGPSIPVYFHFVLATFLLAVGRYHQKAAS